MTTLYGIDRHWGEEPATLASAEVAKEGPKTYRIAERDNNAFDYNTVLRKADEGRKFWMSPGEAWLAEYNRAQATIRDADTKIARANTRQAHAAAEIRKLNAEEDGGEGATG